MKREVKTITTNKKIHFNYSVEHEYMCGILLEGCEIKSIRKHEVNISDSFCYFDGKNGMELFVKDMYIKPYKNRDGFSINIEPNRDRKLLLTKPELRKLSQRMKVKGYTIVPIKLIINENGYCKIVIGLCKGKKLYDKKNDIKERDIRREMEREI